MVWNKLTHEEFLDRVMQKNQYVANGYIVILGRYVDCHSHIKCQCNIHHCIWDSTPTSLYEGCGCKKCGHDKMRIKRKELCDDFLKKLNKLNNGIIMVGPYINMTTKTDFQCIRNHVWSEKPTVIADGSGCPYCSNQRVWVGFNDMWTTRPDVAKLLTDPNDGYQYTSGSNQRVNFTCPDCGCISNKNIVSVSTRGMCCQMCSDGVSYPNKFIRQVLKQCNINFIPEYSPDWIKPMKYDCYFQYSGQEYIVEMDGAFHYMDRPSINKTAKQSQEIDGFKTSEAIKHGIQMVRIECIDSDMSYIKHQILSSSLNDIIDLSNVDWDLCDAKAQKSLVKECCELYVTGVHNLKEIAEKVFIHDATVRRYLRVGEKFGWCDYSNLQLKPVIVLDQHNNILHSFESVASCNRNMRQIYNTTFKSAFISNACKSHKPYKGFNFRFANETQQND